MTDRERDAAALDAVLELADGMLELAEGSLPQVPTADRHVCASGACAWTCSRASRTRLLRQPIGGTRNSCDLEAEA